MSIIDNKKTYDKIVRILCQKTTYTNYIDILRA